MTARSMAGMLAAALLLCAVPAAHADFSEYSHLAAPVRPASAVDPNLLAQRSIDREWGPADDSTYREIDVPGWKSEGFAMAFSGVIPGAGQLYLGEHGGLAFMASEAAFWIGHWIEVDAERREWREMESFIGNPLDSTNIFSFARYTKVTHNDTNALQRLWYGDRAAFYRELDANPVYLEGYISGQGLSAQATLQGYLDAHDVDSRRQWLFDAAVWANHILAALDALRAARLHNAPLREQYHIEVAQGWRDGQREVHAALVRRF